MPGMRYIQVPQPIQLVGPKKKQVIDDDGNPMEPMTMGDFVERLLLGNPKWGETLVNIRSAEAISEAFAVEGDVVQLADDDWTRLRDSVEKPQRIGAQGVPEPGLPLNQSLTRQLLPFLVAIVDAKDKVPPPRVEPARSEAELTAFVEAEVARPGRSNGARAE